MTKNQALKNKYSERYSDYLCEMAKRLENDVIGNIGAYKRIDRINARPKTVDSFLRKARKIKNDKYRYTDPINQIQDQLGIRIITLYLRDIEQISKIVEKYYRPIEKQKIIPDSEKEFGYEGKHYILFVPDTVLCGVSGQNYPKYFELQIKTLFQHAWAEAEHDLDYKSKHAIHTEEKRKLAFIAAQAWGADQIFNEFFSLKKSK